MKLNPQVAQIARHRLFDALYNAQLPEITTIENPLIVKEPNKHCESILLTPEDVMSAYADARAQNPFAKILILNFASFKNPGGGFMNDMYAQEEQLCYCTNLYDELKKHSSWYSYHANKINSGAYTNESMLHKGVTVVGWDFDMLMDPNDYTSVDILTCAAPNYTYALKSNNSRLLDNLKQVTDSRVKYVCDIISTYRYDIAILGAFGCGVFKNDPEVVATSFLTHLTHTGIKQAIFAIPDEKSTNYCKFLSVLQKGLSTDEVRTGRETFKQA